MSDKERREDYIKIGEFIGSVNARLKNIEGGIEEIKTKCEDCQTSINKNSRDIAVLNYIFAGGLGFGVVGVLVKNWDKIFA